jgi:hypothetical protein
MTLKRIFNKFQAKNAKKDEIQQFFFLNSRIMESETTEEVGMEDRAGIECFNFLKFFLGKNLAEMDDCKIYIHFALRLVDPECLNEAVRLLRADGTAIKIIKDGDEESAEEYQHLW